ncbi:hypothetical protein L2E82_23058 [Cichorium intybus]|uniref:Uncharacterized protein n=1 Tax=Cichorium intybus TaxID=13427 RepID=A0ACB9DZ53_CICIN|nr:hypothetical protein L2E82_23058 [Cichorium intybus]
MHQSLTTPSSIETHSSFTSDISRYCFSFFIYMAQIENLAEKDATEKSDVAREAFLAELAQDSKKGATDVSKHLNKRKNKEYRKVKDSTATSNCESESVDEDSSVDIIKQEDEAMRRKIELEAEERKLEETLKTRTEDDDEKRFQADLSKAVRQSLDAFHSQYEGEEDSCSLWHLRRFREEFLSTSTSAHVYIGDLCVICALHDTFKALNMASTDSKSQPVAPTSLRIALSNLYPHSSFFKREAKTLTCHNNDDSLEETPQTSGDAEKVENCSSWKSVSSLYDALNLGIRKPVYEFHFTSTFELKFSNRYTLSISVCCFTVTLIDGISTAPLWDFSKGRFVGVLTALDFILIMREPCGIAYKVIPLDKNQKLWWFIGVNGLETKTSSFILTNPRTYI